MEHGPDPPLVRSFIATQWFSIKFDKVTCWSVIVPYGTPPGVLNLDNLPKCLGVGGGGGGTRFTAGHKPSLSRPLIKDTEQGSSIWVCVTLSGFLW